MIDSHKTISLTLRLITNNDIIFIGFAKPYATSILFKIRDLTSKHERLEKYGK